MIIFLCLAIDMISHRQKLVQLADSSELGWRVVAEYEANPLASDSDDEKRIYKAEARASRKMKADKLRRSKARALPYARRSTVSSAPGFNRVPQGVMQQHSGVTSRQRPGLCFACGGSGHWKAECPQRGQSNNKISLHSFVDNSDNPEVVIHDRSSGGTEVSVGSDSHCVSRPKCAPECADNNAQSVSPVGRLRGHITTWKNVSNDAYILDVVENGYKFPFKVDPVSIVLKNNKSARDNPDFVVSEIQSLLQKGVVKEVVDIPKVVNPLTVAYGRSGKPRLVLDCRHINPCLHLFKIKFEDMKVAEAMFDKCSYIFTFDLKSAYHHIDICESHSTYLGFSWQHCDGSVRYYVYRSLPFGASVSGHIFSKTLRVPIKYWRSLGYRIVMFLDDGIGGDVDNDRAAEASHFIRNSLIWFFGRFGKMQLDTF